MNRREFLSVASVVAVQPVTLCRASEARRPIRALVLVDFNGGNDGLNTVIPFADARYHALRPTLAIPRDQALRIDERTGLHPALRPLMAAWHAGECAIVQGVGYAQPNRSHYRAQQIWHTASEANEYRRDAWLARFQASQTAPVHPASAPFDTRSFTTSCKAAASAIVANRAQKGVTVIRLTLDGFDTHEHQAARHASLLAQFADGIASLRSALLATADWRSTLVMTRSEFGRSARENDTRGTEHGAAAPQFVLGGAVRGGLFGEAPRLDALDAEGGLTADVDFRRLCATALDGCWNVDPATILGRPFEPLPLLRA
ncbi:DUF1501 domain-containing protein [Caballeronia sp. LZ062]|uniref:DUF1501 domain-containing protein n=1 Tax=unclassified Caballeronia TaxID=2646786 RepID=UPI00285CA532|nr:MULTISPECIES: DUF1501 domain-containing protein [unclassified Caballeronia]MDR5854480.1 DUF1501 domain-containing protein [Caballeronia sp. LZ050]MDR5870990.1 DUF1501 domain-containing protein [Caballeronia sp. LZ062]